MNINLISGVYLIYPWVLGSTCYMSLELRCQPWTLKGKQICYQFTLHFSISWDVCVFPLKSIHLFIRYCHVLVYWRDVFCTQVGWQYCWKFHRESIYIPSASNQFCVLSRPSLIYSIRKSTSVTSPSTSNSTHPVFNFLFFLPMPRIEHFKLTVTPSTCLPVRSPPKHTSVFFQKFIFLSIFLFAQLPGTGAGTLALLGGSSLQSFYILDLWLFALLLVVSLLFISMGFPWNFLVALPPNHSIRPALSPTSVYFFPPFACYFICWFNRVLKLPSCDWFRRGLDLRRGWSGAMFIG